MSVGAPDEATVRRLINRADEAASAGRAAEALHLLQEAQRGAPRHPLVLNALGLHAFRSGDFGAGRGYFEEAVRVDARSPLLWLHLAIACRGQGDADAELAALDNSLALDAHFYLALLQKATLLERLSKPKRAAQLYAAYLKCVPQSAQQLPAVQEAMRRARNAVAANTVALERFLAGRLAATRARHTGAPLERFERCLDVVLEKRHIYQPQPTLMHFPFLPALEFYPRADFPWLEALEAATGDIRDELRALLAADAEGIVPYVDYPDSSPLDQWKELNHSRRWGAYYLMQNGKRLDDHLRRCPRTAALLAAAPLAQVPGQAPTAFFSMLQPHTRIPPHTGVTNTRLVVHLPLVVPPGCGFRVGAEIREWRPGQAWVFDDTIEHEAWNDSDQPRAILIIDIWNPLLTLAERELVSAATAAVAEYSHE
jgi:aspartate beta-hydroxylase